MTDYIFSKHALEQMAHRNLTEDMIDGVMKNPDKSEQTPDELIVQGKMKRDGSEYLLRIFVNHTKQPKLIKPVYVTSKLSKYK